LLQYFKASRKPYNGDDQSLKKMNPGPGCKETGDGAQETYHISITTNRISLYILPVVVKAKGFDTGLKVYALLDDGSTGVVFKESLLDKLGVTGMEAVLETTTIIGKSKGYVMLKNL
jgi:hypothetical protein